jgi:hypothetical protein
MPLSSNQFINYGDATNTRLPRHLLVQTKGDLSGSGKFKEYIIIFVNRGSSYKPQSYVNNLCMVILLHLLLLT